jgi:hypothetical protein
MPIEYANQASIVADKAFRDRVEAGCMIVALSVAAETISGGPTARARLADAVIGRADFAVLQFCWAIVGKQQVNTIDDLKDQQINTVVTQQWNVIADALTPPPPPGGP